MSKRTWEKRSKPQGNASDGRKIPAIDQVPPMVIRSQEPFVLSDEQRISHIRTLFNHAPWERLHKLLYSWKPPLRRLILVLSNRPGADAGSTPFGNLSGAEFLSTQDHRTETPEEAKKLVEKYAVVLMDIDVREVFKNMEDLADNSSCLYGKFMGPTTYIMATKYTTECIMTRTIRSLSLKAKAKVVKETYIPNTGEQYWLFNKHSMVQLYSDEQLWMLSKLPFNKGYTRPQKYRNTYLPIPYELSGYLYKQEQEKYAHVRHLELNDLSDFFGIPFLFEDLYSVRIYVDERVDICGHQTFVIPATGAKEVHVTFNTCHVPCVEIATPIKSTERFTLVNKKWQRENPYGDVCFMGTWNKSDQAHWMVDYTYPPDSYAFLRLCEEIKLVGLNDTYLMLLQKELLCIRSLVWKRLAPVRGSPPVWAMDPTASLASMERLEVHDLLHKNNASENPQAVQFQVPFLKEFKHVMLTSSSRAWVPWDTFTAECFPRELSKLTLIRDRLGEDGKKVIPIRRISLKAFHHSLKDLTISGFSPLFVKTASQNNIGIIINGEGETMHFLPQLKRLSVDISDIPLEHGVGTLGYKRVKLMLYAEEVKFPMLKVLQLTASHALDQGATEHLLIIAKTSSQLRVLEIANEIRCPIVRLNGECLQPDDLKAGEDGFRRWRPARHSISEWEDQ